MTAATITDERVDSGTTTTGTSGAELAIAALRAHGVDTVFGIPGVHTLALYDALIGSSVKHILARHEQGVGFMADGYARASGNPGVALVITGPGITNVATPIAEAYTDSSPVFVLSSNVERAYVDQMRGSLHDLKDQLGVSAAFTQWNARVDAAAHVPAAVAEGFARLRTGRARPVHVEIPTDVLDEQISGVESSIAIAPPAERLAPDPSLLDEAARRIAASRNVVFWCGGGAVAAGAQAAIVALAERLGAPVLTSIMGKGTIPEDHPLAVGALWAPDNAIDELLRDADCLVVVGSKLGHDTTRGFRLPFPPEVIRVDVDEREMTLNARPTLPILGDAVLAAEGIEARLERTEHRADGIGAERTVDARASAKATAFGADRLPYVDALRQAIPRDGIITHDMTMMSYASCAHYPVYEPRTFFFPSGYGTLGFSLPAAIGAKVAKPLTPVVCVCGDGGFQFTMAELATAVQYRLGIPIVIFHDSAYSAVKDAQAASRGRRFIAVDLVNPDFVALAHAYDIPGVRAESPDALRQEIGHALERDLPTIIDVPIEPWV